jgi:hypothetical protein
VGFEHIPERPAAQPVEERHLCAPPKVLPDGSDDIPAGTVWRCEGCGAVSVAEIWATWYGILIFNVLLPAFLFMKMMALLAGLQASTAWTRRKTFFWVAGICYGLSALFVWISLAQSIYLST